MINSKKLDELIAIGEGYYFETKVSLDKSLAKEAVAFANSSGGVIVLGIDDDGQKIGLENSNRVISKVQDIINQIQPQIKANVYKLENLIVVEVFEGNNKPYAASSGFYIRIGANSQKLNRHQIISFFQAEGKIKFDELICHQAVFEKDFNQNAFNKFLELSGISSSLNNQTILRNLGCLDEENKFTNAGALMFTKSIDFLMNHASVVCILYQAENKLKIIDKKNFTDDLINNIEQALNFVQRNTKTEYVFTGKARRQEVTDYPLKAVREAIVNAICHRDYFERGSQTLIEIYSDRLEVSNPGGLPKGLNEKDFGKRSLARNPLLASLLHRANYMERVGTGILRIKEQVNNHYKELAVDIEYDNFYSLKFIQKLSQNYPKTIPKLSQNYDLKLSATSRKILDLISENRFILISELEEKTNLSRAGVKYHLNILKRKDILKRVGSNKGGHWFINGT